MKFTKDLLGTVLLSFASALPGAGLGGDQAHGEGEESRAGREVQKTTEEKAGPFDPAAVPVYHPPLRGAPPPTRLVGGGTRSSGKAQPRLAVLAPEHTGLTATNQPVLYWYVSAPVGDRLELTIIDETAIQPLLEAALDPPVRVGVQRVALADYDLSLRPGVTYQWSIALVPDPDKRSRDVITSGTIKYLDPPRSLADKLVHASPMARPYLYAEAGYWYDALTALSTLIDQAPAGGSLRQKRAALLEQVGLLEVAAYDRQLAESR
ncbi:MAG: hypothetical protein Kow0060_06870 [Methylohalobius crimeensis]